MAKSSPAVLDYLKSRERANRLDILEKLAKAKTTIPIDLVDDLLELGISDTEKHKLISLVDTSDNLAFEHFITRNFPLWDQELAATGLRLWASASNNLMWYRFPELAKSNIISQRVLYTMLDTAYHSGGIKIIEAIVSRDDLFEYSQAFHALLLWRSIQWNFHSSTLDDIAVEIYKSSHNSIHPENKAALTSVIYLRKFAPQKLTPSTSEATNKTPLDEITWNLGLKTSDSKSKLSAYKKLLAKPPKTNLDKKIIDSWPCMWDRHELSGEEIRFAVDSLHKSKSISWEFFSGCSVGALIDCLEGMEDTTTLCWAITTFYGLLDRKSMTTLIKQKSTKLKQRKETSGLPEYITHLLIDKNHVTDLDTAAVIAEQNAILEGKTPQKWVEFFSQSQDSESQNRKAFFDLFYRATETETNLSDDIWSELIKSCKTPSEDQLDQLSEKARQLDGVYRLCYLETLGKFKNIDRAALKTLDYIRTKEEDELRAIIKALHGIKTPRSAMEMINILTRPNITAILQIETCQLLQTHDLTSLQKELRSALHDLKQSGSNASHTNELTDALSALLHTEPAEIKTIEKAIKIPVNSAKDQDLNQALNARIQNFNALSSEVKRALRTAQFFHNQVISTSDIDSIDLSPVIDMQYKALELLFRESFEDVCSVLIHNGTLQRKLDIIGYARPIPKAMDEFEAYISKLPVIQNIPFFSKFKMRKMMRAICQFRPGKRFTLDGLKAFAIFFICFGRQQCRYGLNNLFDLGYNSDAELFEFCKSLHILQDARNRAAHEGFQPDASNDIDGIWLQTAGIIANVFQLNNHLNSQDGLKNYHAGKPQHAPVITKKVS